MQNNASTDMGLRQDMVSSAKYPAAANPNDNFWGKSSVTKTFMEIRNHAPGQLADANSDDRGTSEKLRKVLRKVPFPVVVVSTASPHDSSLRRGITVSSFTSISLQPIPLIAFSVKLPSRASTVLHESDRFVVQFLAADQIPHSVAFSSTVSPPPSYSTPSTLTSRQPQQQESRSGRSTRAPGDKDTEDLVSEASEQTLVDNDGMAATGKPRSIDSDSGRLQATTDPDPFEVLGYETDAESSLPVLLNTLGAVRCRTHQVMVVGDHEMWIGHVEKVLHGEIPSPGQEPLLYHDRSYRKVGRRIL
ncbi:hypothetical protein KVV02_007170 [Mortierella alpina]|uniref:Flavin reductase like domain-containing protein n=1 Tax=Mortierella alpina TaxID=64518 RepID=A0A9P8A3R7_MORAP|nr:hypothetical protein KVV02_007170 [Mortierella alpina]